MDETMPGEARELNVIHKISNKLKFHSRKNAFFDTETETPSLECTKPASFSLHMFSLVCKSNGFQVFQ